jgi:hypothetical protein
MLTIWSVCLVMSTPFTKHCADCQFGFLYKNWQFCAYQNYEKHCFRVIVAEVLCKINEFSPQLTIIYLLSVIAEFLNLLTVGRKLSLSHINKDVMWGVGGANAICILNLRYKRR